MHKPSVTENEHLRQEVLSKTQQVKQYKKQVDKYKEKVLNIRSKYRYDWLHMLLVAV